MRPASRTRGSAGPGDTFISPDRRPRLAPASGRCSGGDAQEPGGHALCHRRCGGASRGARVAPLPPAGFPMGITTCPAAALAGACGRCRAGRRRRAPSPRAAQVLRGTFVLRPARVEHEPERAPSLLTVNPTLPAELARLVEDCLTFAPLEGPAAQDMAAVFGQLSAR
jgi:hypothetical protein